jgi:hypothetical protein
MPRKIRQLIKDLQDAGYISCEAGGQSPEIQTCKKAGI